MGKKIFIIIVFIITIVYTLIIFNQPYRPAAKNGELDLRDWDFKKNGSILLRGEWELFYGDLLSYKKIANSNLKGDIVSVPSLWSKYGYSNLGYATYKLEVYVNRNQFSELAVRIPYEPSAYELYINNVPILQNGTVGINKEKSIPEYFPKYSYFNLYQDKITFIMHISNFQNSRGGFQENIRLGTSENIYSRFENDSRIELLISSIIFLIGVYLLITYYLTVRDKSMLIFSLVCFVVALRNLVIRNKLVLQYIKTLPWEYMIKIEYVLSLLAPILYIHFCYSYFSIKKYPYPKKIYSLVGIIFITLVIFTSPLFFTKYLVYLYMYVLLGFALAILCITEAYKQRNDRLEWFIYTVFIVLVAVINDIINDAFSLSPYILVPYAMMIAASIQVIFFTNNLYNMVNKSQKLARENEKINTELATLNNNLEKIVKLRTLELEEMLKMDPMTKLYNHKYILKLLEKEIISCIDKGANLCLCLMDVDDFKKINDYYGHLHGDEVLNKISNVLMTFDDRVTAGRYGGEEFILILSNVNIQKSFEICNNIRKEVEKLIFSEETLKVTLSGGIVEYQEKETVGIIVGRADKLLYKAKAEGKNKICI